jgi:hypothetical protein
MNNDRFPVGWGGLSGRGGCDEAPKIMGEIPNRIWSFAQIFPVQFVHRWLI